MQSIIEFLQSVPEEYLYLVAAMVAEQVVQFVKRWIPSIDAVKLVKLLSAAIVTGLFAAGAYYSGAGEFVQSWLVLFAGAIGLHEVKDKATGAVADAVIRVAVE